MAYNGIAKIQHYVPQFLLKKFGNGKKDQLHVFDKKSGRSFPTNAKNVACESRFYDFKINDIEATLEPKLSELEGLTKPLFERILDQDSVDVFDKKEKSLMSDFFAIQFTRTKSFREQLLSAEKITVEKLKLVCESSREINIIENCINQQTENDIKIQMADLIMAAPSVYGPYFENKTWHLLSTTRKNPFYISDNPLTLQNRIKNDFFGNLGLAVKGIEIYFPISPTRALAMWCPTHKKTIMSAAHLLEKRNFVDAINDELKNLEKMVLSMKSGNPIEFSSENVINFNALQVSYAERYVFSSADDFTLPKKMLLAHPSLRKGRRMSVM